MRTPSGGFDAIANDLSSIEQGERHSSYGNPRIATCDTGERTFLSREDFCHHSFSLSFVSLSLSFSQRPPCLLDYTRQYVVGKAPAVHIPIRRRYVRSRHGDIGTELIRRVMQAPLLASRR
jgi:hypothetical protein